MSSSLSEPLAVVGLACRFPGGAGNPESFWNLLREGRDAVAEVPPTRWSLEAYYDPDPSVTGKMYVRQGGFIYESPFEFDAGFFRINPHEAVRLDPQQRLVLEVAWEAIEDAGIPLERLAGSRTGVYVGVFCLDNMLIHFSEQNHASLNAHTAAAATMAIVANRVSYTFDLRGPSLSLDTACSSSLVGFHLACQALRVGECDYAMAGGVNVMMKPEYTISMCKGKYLSPDGRCKAFDASGDGYGRGEGAGMILLERLSDALAAGDRVYAIVRGTGANQDGATPGISVPNPDSQMALLRDVYGRAGVPPESIQYVEAHGTGTAVGDPYEALALGSVLSVGRSPDEPCRIGSVKTNIAHLEAAAGVAGAMKAILSVHHGLIPPSLHFKNPNPTIDFAGLKLKVQTQLELWPDTHGGPRRAGVNSFGYGGTNAHVLLESAPPDLAPEDRTPDRDGVPFVFPVSARSVDAVRAMAARYADALGPGGRLAATPLADVMYSACLRRTHHERRAGLVADSRAGLVAHLRAVETGEVEIATAPGIPEPGPCFVYTGMGPQWWGMGKELYREHPVFREKVDGLGSIFRDILHFDIVQELLRDEATSRATQTQVAQPLNFLVQMGLTEVLRDRGILPAAVVGHSVGEIAAAAASGALGLADAACVIFHRGRLLARAAGQGGMLAVGLSEAEVRAFVHGLEDQIGIAAINGPSTVTLSGDQEILDSLAELLEGEGVFAKKLRVEVPYHSPRMDPLREELIASLAGLEPRAPACPLWSTVSGLQVEGVAHDAAYWWSNMRNSVRFADATNDLLRRGFRHFVEIGPHPVLAASIRECAQAQGVPFKVLSTLVRDRPERQALAEATAGMWQLGYQVRWEHQIPPGRRFVALPMYPWQRQRYWEESDATRRSRLGYAGHPLLGHPVVGPKPIRQVELNQQYFPWLADHCVDGTAVFPGVAYAELGLALATPGPEQAVAVEGLEFVRPLVLSGGDPPVAQIHHDLRTGEFEVHSTTAGSEGGWVLCARGSVRVTNPGPWNGTTDLDAVRRRCTTSWDVADLYARLADTGLNYGPRFRGLLEVHSGDDEVIALVHGPSDGGRFGDAYRVHPTVLDAGLQALAAAAAHRDLLGAGRRFLPTRIGRVTSYAPIDGPVFVHTRMTRITAAGFSGDMDFLSESGTPLVSMRGVQCTLIAARPAQAPAWKTLLYEPRWRPSPPSGERAFAATTLVFAPPELSGDVALLLHKGGIPHVELGSASQKALPDVEAVVWVAGVTSSQDQADAAIAETAAFADLLRTLGAQETGPLVVMVTRGAHHLGPGHRASDLAGSPLWGLARVARLEYPGLRLRSVDLDQGDLVPLVEELSWLDDAETEIAWHRGKRLVRRVERTDATCATAPWPPLRGQEARAAFVLKSETPGQLDGLRLRRIDRRAPGRGEVEVAVKSAPINFKDVMKALGMLSSRVLTPTHFGDELGMECGGVVVRTGDGVQGFRVGDRVGLSYQGSFRSHVTTDTTYMVALPPTMNLEDGAGLITPMLAAWYALVERGRVRKGERILIHSATGGAGLSAIQIATWIGAEVFATAGTPERRDYLRGLGVRHVSDSRSLAFFDDVMEWTKGEGIDVVLNTLAGEGLFKGLELLKPYGRFIEFGKRDIDLNTPLGLAPFNENLDFIAVDFDRLRAERPDECARIMREVWKGLEAGYFHPLPCKSYPISQAPDAFSVMARSQHLGKLALSFDDPAAVVHPALPDAAPPSFGGTWLVVGGLSGLGLAVAKWAASRGVRHLVLASRRGVEAPEAVDGVAELERMGVNVRAVAADVTSLDDVRTLVATEALGLPALRGVVHSAAVLDDATIAALRPDQVERVMGAKVRGALHLHRCTQDQALDVFLMFSSISSMLGNAGQAAYAAANAFLDSLAQERRAGGLPALTINWGVIGDTGMVARAPELRQQLDRIGMRGLGTDQVTATLDRLLRLDPVQVGVMDVDWRRWVASHPQAARQPVLTELAAAASFGASEGQTDLASSLGAMSEEERVAYLVAGVHKIVAETMRIALERIDPAEPIRNLGLDSLMAVELATALERRLGIPIPSMELMSGPSVRQLAEKIAARCAAAPAVTPQES
jgi:acyl transferase domain-containing protein/NAD(P)-dependent dehydrogenase (short-subunit alcohol dehydrogenase family)/threonine dehydrogenase-like Zn-dependent dehydrogenase/acyl carrier protein